VSALNDLVVVRDLRQWFPLRGGLFGRSSAHVKAVDGVSFSIRKGEVLGLVGESGSGKTTVGRTILRLLAPTGGAISFRGHDITALSRRRMRPIRRGMQLIFQDPFASLNPRMTVGRIIATPLDVHETRLRAGDKHDRINQALTMVGLSPEFANRYPHEFSGGQRQRIGIARALILRPEFLVADEPVSALDVSIQAQIVNLLSDLKNELGLTMLFIAHDLAVVGHISDRIAVMYLGKLMELAPAEVLFTAPLHPYTEALFSAVPDPDPTVRRQRIILKGEVPSPIAPPSGCVFRTRCRYAVAACAVAAPEFREVAPGHFKACIRDDLALQGSG
jgi:oligopeptide/dipeptide ABC transporter ATP-binding protein